MSQRKNSSDMSSPSSAPMMAAAVAAGAVVAAGAAIFSSASASAKPAKTALLQGIEAFEAQNLEDALTHFAQAIYDGVEEAHWWVHYLYAHTSENDNNLHCQTYHESDKDRLNTEPSEKFQALYQKAASGFFTKITGITPLKTFETLIQEDKISSHTIVDVSALVKGCLLLEQGQLELALKLFETIHTNNKFIIYCLADILEAYGYYEQAAKKFELYQRGGAPKDFTSRTAHTKELAAYKKFLAPYQHLFINKPADFLHPLINRLLALDLESFKDTDKIGDTALHIASRLGLGTDVLQFLTKEVGLSPQTLNRKQQSALHAAAEGKNTDAIRFFHARGINIDSKDQHHHASPMMLAVMHDHVDGVKDMLPHTEDKQSFVDLAVRHGATTVIEHLVAVDPQKLDEGAPLFAAARAVQKKAFDKLLELGARLDVKVGPRHTLVQWLEEKESETWKEMRDTLKSRIDLRDTKSKAIADGVIREQINYPEKKRLELNYEQKNFQEFLINSLNKDTFYLKHLARLVKADITDEFERFTEILRKNLIDEFKKYETYQGIQTSLIEIYIKIVCKKVQGPVSIEDFLRSLESRIHFAIDRSVLDYYEGLQHKLFEEVKREELKPEVHTHLEDYLKDCEWKEELKELLLNDENFRKRADYLAYQEEGFKRYLEEITNPIFAQYPKKDKKEKGKAARHHRVEPQRNLERVKRILERATLQHESEFHRKRNENRPAVPMIRGDQRHTLTRDGARTNASLLTRQSDSLFVPMHDLRPRAIPRDQHKHDEDEKETPATLTKAPSAPPTDEKDLRVAPPEARRAHAFYSSAAAATASASESDAINLHLHEQNREHYLKMFKEILIKGFFEAQLIVDKRLQEAPGATSTVATATSQIAAKATGNLSAYLLIASNGAQVIDYLKTKWNFSSYTNIHSAFITIGNNDPEIIMTKISEFANALYDTFQFQMALLNGAGLQQSAIRDASAILQYLEKGNHLQQSSWFESLGTALTRGPASKTQQAYNSMTLLFTGVIKGTSDLDGHPVQKRIPSDATLNYAGLRRNTCIAHNGVIWRPSVEDNALALYGVRFPFTDAEEAGEWLSAMVSTGQKAPEKPATAARARR